MGVRVRLQGVRLREVGPQFGVPLLTSVRLREVSISRSPTVLHFPKNNIIGVVSHRWMSTIGRTSVFTL